MWLPPNETILFMSKLIINSYEEFAAYEGKKLGESEWLVWFHM